MSEKKIRQAIDRFCDDLDRFRQRQASRGIGSGIVWPMMIGAGLAVGACTDAVALYGAPYEGGSAGAGGNGGASGDGGGGVGGAQPAYGVPFGGEGGTAGAAGGGGEGAAGGASSGAGGDAGSVAIYWAPDP